MKKALALLALTISLVISLAACSGIIGHVHQYGDWIATKIATCTEAGEQTRYCDCGDKQSDTIAAIGHNYVDGECVNCGDVKETSECKHTNLDVLSAVESTCTETGLTEGVSCLDCGKILSAQQTIPMKEHTEIVDPGYSATCTDPGLSEGKHCLICGTVLVEQTTIPAIAEDMGHIWELNGDYVIAPTCGTDGKGYAICKVCGCDYVNADTDNLYEFLGTATDEGHEFAVDVPAKSPTCSEQGYEAHKACKYCGKLEGDITPIPATGHETLVKVDASRPNCENPGMKAHYICTVCGTYFDENKTETTKEALITAMAGGHDYDLENSVPTFRINPTCTTYGYDIYCCTRCGMLAEIDDSENKGIVRFDPINHVWEPDSGSMGYDCEEDIKYTQTCTLCGEIQTFVNPAIGHDYIEIRHEATCGSVACTEVICSRCDYYEIKYGTETNPSRHDLQVRITTPALCGQIGVKITYCANEHCDLKPVEEQFVVEHYWVLNDTESQTPETGVSGYNVYVCAVCCEVRTVGALEHEWKLDKVAAPTCNTSGYNAYICTYCGETKTTAIAPEHEWRLDSVASTAPTCNFPGYSVYTCVTCGIIKTETVDISEHALYVGEIIEYVAPSCGQDGRIVYACSACGAQSTEMGEKFDPLNPKHHGDNGMPTWACHNPNHVYYVHPDGTTGTEPCDCHETTIYRLGNCYTYELVQYYCSVCDVRYHVITEGTGPSYDENGNIIHKDKVIDKPAQAPTCYEDGWTAVWHCDCCGEKSGAAKPVEKIAHANKYFVEASPTVGNLEYWHCPDCGTYFYVVNGENKESNQMPFVDSVNHN